MELYPPSKKQKICSGNDIITTQPDNHPHSSSTTGVHHSTISVGSPNRGTGQSSPSLKDNTLEDMKFSQNVSIVSLFKNNSGNSSILSRAPRSTSSSDTSGSHAGFNKDIKVIVVKPNDNINKKLSKILKIIKENDNTGAGSNELGFEILFVSRNEGIQKLITIFEILKQKLNTNTTNVLERTENNKKHKVKNDKLAVLENQSTIIINDEELTKRLSFRSFKQFNCLDYELLQRKELTNKRTNKRKISQANDNIKNKDEFTFDELNELKMSKVIKVPVLYIYLNLRSRPEVSVKLGKRFDELIEGGWSLQEQ